MKNKHISSLSRIERERVRLKAAKLFQKDMSQTEVARRLKATPAAVNYWYKAWKSRGVRGLKSRGHPGFESKLTEEKRLLFKRAILKGPLNHGYQTDLWTLPKLSQVLRKVTGFRCSDVWTWHIVRNLGFTPQKPQVKAKERDEEGIRRWKRYIWPQVKREREQWAPV